MFPKLLALIFALVLTAGLLLGLRHERLALRHEMVQLHREMDEQRQQTWALQTRIAEMTTPARIEHAMHRLGVEAEPVDPGLAPDTPASAVVPPVHKFRWSER